jgi:hypothetical protein
MHIPNPNLPLLLQRAMASPRCCSTKLQWLIVLIPFTTIPFSSTYFICKSWNIPLVFSLLDSLSIELVVIIIIILDVVENLFPLSRHIWKASGYPLFRINPFQVPLSKPILWFLENCMSMVKTNSLVFLRTTSPGSTYLTWVNQYPQMH